ncbi:MAG TPA: DUF2231 domain-containing protein [Enhygromyxa sp.]|nr:DUF2231 domain-containing protein [Enhygromyxa sp.]
MQNQAVVHHAQNRPDAMQASTLEPAPSKAAIAGHPIHPMLIPFPVALLSLVPVTDIVFAVTESTFWSSVSYYLLWAGLISAGLAAIVGLVDFIGVPRVRSVRAGWAHLLLNVAIVALSVVNLLLRWGDTIGQIEPSGIILSLVATGLLLVSGWYGGELTYRHKVGVIP